MSTTSRLQATALSGQVALAVTLAVAGCTDATRAAPVDQGHARTAARLSDIPADYQAWYMAAAQTCPGLSWTVLAAVGTIESSNGMFPGPGVRSGTNFAGAEGPMQFKPESFARYAVNADPSARLSPYDPADAVFTAAHMLCARGAKDATPAGLRKALRAYNNASWYVDDVLAQAARFQRLGDASAAARQAVTFAEAQLGKLAAGADGCVDLARAAYEAAGVTIGRTPADWAKDGPVVPLSRIEPGDLLFSAGLAGTTKVPGRVVLYIGGGQVIETPRPGQPVQIDPADLTGVTFATRPADLAASR